LLIHKFNDWAILFLVWFLLALPSLTRSASSNP